jgi:hypothetical protein
VFRPYIIEAFSAYPKFRTILFLFGIVCRKDFLFGILCRKGITVGTGSSPEEENIFSRISTTKG